MSNSLPTPHTQSMELAQRLRAIYLPSSPPVIPGYELYWCYAPVNEVEGVSGDCLDAILDDDMLFFIIGDVSGKGLRAAKSSVMVCNMWRGILSCEQHPTFILAALDHAVNRFFEEDQFMTMVCGCLHLSTGLLSVANAGHPPGILKHHGTCQILKVGDSALGIGYECTSSTKGEEVKGYKRIPYEASEYYLSPGDQLLFYTDGITEAKNMLELYGEHRLLEAFQNSPDTNVLELLFQDVKSWTTAGLCDDAALLWLQKT